MSRRCNPMVMLALALLPTAAMLVGCQGSGNLRTSPYIGFDAYLEGMQLIVERPLEIPAGQARLFFQDRGPVDPGSLARGRYDLYRPHCALEIDSVDHAGFAIQPGRFLVTRVERSVVSVVLLSSPRLAALSAGWGSWYSRSDRFHDGYHFWLHSDEQNAVRRLSCYGVYARWPDLFPPTLQEINNALGDAATLGGPVVGDG